MKLVVGLGNPGREYEHTRHNAGWLALDVLAARHAPGAVATSKFGMAMLDARIGGEKVVLCKPTKFMNRSGGPVAEAVGFYKLEPADDLIVLVDEVALPVGHVRVRQSGGTGGHNGLADIDRALGGRDYPRVRIGVGAVPRLMDKADWVLSKFMPEERDDADRSFRLAADAVETCLEEGTDVAMNRFNKKLKPETPPEHPNDRGGATDDTNARNDNDTQTTGAANGSPENGD